MCISFSNLKKKKQERAERVFWLRCKQPDVS